MRLLVTGSTGFIGRHTIPLLSALASRLKWELVAWDRGTHGDLFDFPETARVVRGLKPDMLLNLAWAKTGIPGYEHDSTNLEWVGVGKNLAEACARWGVQFVGLGSCVEYTAQQTDSAYRDAKLLLHEAAASLLSPSEFTWLMPFWVVSRAEGRPRVVAEYLAALDRGCAFQPRHPEAALDFIVVDDLARAIPLILESRLTGDLDIGSGTLRTVESLLAAMGRPAGVAAMKNPTPSQATPPKPGTRADVSRLLVQGWRPLATDLLFENLGE